MPWWERLWLRDAGRVDAYRESAITTRFVHLAGLPLLPVQSHIVARGSGTDEIRIPIRLHARSAVSGYVRSWSVAGALALVALGLWLPGSSAWIALAAPLAVILACLAAASLWLGYLTPDEAGQHDIYAAFAQLPVDVALLPEHSDGASSRRAVWHRAEQILATRALDHAAASYRDRGAPEKHWRAIATSPEVRDPELLSAALTMARLAWAHGAGRRERAGFAAAHRLIWAKLAAAPRPR